MTNTSQKLHDTLLEIDKINQEDPNQEVVNGETISKELLYSKRMRTCLQQFLPDASEVLQIAAYCQHVKRWALPRSDYPMNKAGYKKWRTTLGKFHASITAEVMRTQGYEAEAIERAEYLLQKKGLKLDPETQALEDVICLVFMEFYLEPFAAKHSEEKLIDIIQKTWRKMSENGHQAALALPFKPHLLEVVKKALGV